MNASFFATRFACPSARLEKRKGDTEVAAWLNGMLALAERKLDGEDVSKAAVRGRGFEEALEVRSGKERRGAKRRGTARGEATS